jgi:MarR family transcriptional regulator, organic hydroperoxide resistance regulator
MARARDAKRRGDPAAAGFRLEDSPFFLMNRAVATYALAMERALRAVGADIPRWRVLMLAHEYGPVSVGRIAEGAVMKLPTATKVVQRLNREGLVRIRRALHDARVTEVELTAAGHKAVQVIRQVASRMYRSAFGDFGASDIQALNTALNRVHRNLQNGG